MRIDLAVVLLSLLALPTTGCVKSSTTQASSGSLSDSASSPFSASSNSSSEDDSDDEDSAFRRDVSDYAATFAPGGGDARGFARGLGAIAESHGITDWESRLDTYHAVGRGLAHSAVDDSRYSNLAVSLANERFERLAAIRNGYASATP